MPSESVSNREVLDVIVGRMLPAKACDAIVAAARAGHGAARNLAAIVGLAQTYGARPEVVAAAFGFLARLGEPSKFVDVLTDEDEIAELPNDDEVRAAFALSRAVAPDGAPFVVS
jgi:hypothetical protein